MKQYCKQARQGYNAQIVNSCSFFSRIADSNQNSNSIIQRLLCGSFLFNCAVNAHAMSLWYKSTANLFPIHFAQHLKKLAVKDVFSPKLINKPPFIAFTSVSVDKMMNDNLLFSFQTYLIYLNIHTDIFIRTTTLVEFTLKGWSKEFQLTSPNVTLKCEGRLNYGYVVFFYMAPDSNHNIYRTKLVLQ